MGIPIPRLTFMPSFSSSAALFTIRSRIFDAASVAFPVDPSANLIFSMRFSVFDDCTIAFTKSPGRCISLGFSSPFSTSSSTSAIVYLAALAQSGLKFCAVLLN